MLMIVVQNHVVNALLLPSIYLPVKLSIVNVLMVLLTVRHSTLMEHARHAMTNMSSLVIRRHVVLALIRPSIYLLVRLLRLNVLLARLTVPKPILLEHARLALITMLSLVMPRHVVLALLLPSIYLLVKLSIPIVSMVLLTVKHSMLMEHARLAPPTMFFLVMLRHVVLALIKPSTYLLAKLSPPTVLLVLISVPNVMLMEHARHALMVLISLMIRRLAKLVILDVLNVLELELESVLIALPNTGQRVMLANKSAQLVILDVTPVLITELASVLHALHTTLRVVMPVKRHAQLVLLENTYLLVKVQLLIAHLALMVNT